MNFFLFSCVSMFWFSFYGSDIGNVVFDNKINSIILEIEVVDLGNDEWSKKLGMLGILGFYDLEIVLRWLFLCWENYFLERRFFEEE